MKKLLYLCLVGVLCFTLVGCGNKDNNNNNNENGNNNNGGAFEYGEDFINKNLKGDFWLIYKITHYEGGDRDSRTIEIRKTDKGYFFATSDDEDGILFIKNGDVYDWYGYSDGVYKSIGLPMEKEAVEGMMAGLTMYMSGYAAYDSMLNKTGSDTVAGRSCDKFAMDFSYPYANYKYKHTYCIDKATGVGLKLTVEAQSGGQKAGYEFEATKFQTSGVTLPEYE